MHCFCGVSFFLWIVEVENSCALFNGVVMLIIAAFLVALIYSITAVVVLTYWFPLNFFLQALVISIISFGSFCGNYYILDSGQFTLRNVAKLFWGPILVSLQLTVVLPIFLLLAPILMLRDWWRRF